MAVASRLDTYGNFSVQNTGIIDEVSISSLNQYSASFNGSSQYLSIPTNALLDFGTSTDFTIEAWIFPTTLTPGGGGNSNGLAVVAGYGSTATPTGYFFGFLPTGYLYASSYVAGTAQSLTATTNPITINTWQHITITRSGSTYRMFVNGVSVTFTGSITQTFSTNGSPINIGALLNTTFYDYFTGYISNVRIIKGTAVYTANFVPPTATLIPITNTSLLTCQNATIVDNSPNALTITNNGSVTTTNATLPTFSTIAQQYSNGALVTSNIIDEVSIPNNSYAAQFNGSSQYLVASGTQSNGLTSENFTFELSFYLTSLTFSPSAGLYLTVPWSAAGNGTLNNTPGAGSIVWMFISGSTINTPTAITFGSGGQNPTGPNFGASGLSIPFNTWHHVAVSRNGANMAIWFNGVKVASITNASGNYTSGTSAIGVNTGSNAYAGYFPGYIANFRIVKGTPLYDPTGGNIVVPTAPLTAVSGTYLLTCQNSTIVDNSTNAFTIVNNNSVTTTNFPLTFYSGSFNGPYLTVPSNTGFSFGTGDFTFECWLYVSAPNASYNATTDRLVFGGYNASSPTLLFFLQGDNNTPAIWNGTIQRNSTIAVPTNTWTHVAWVRSSSTLTIYVNGVVGFTIGSYTTSFASAGTWYIGKNDIDNTRYFPGSISNLRVVKGVAVYTSAFTPPTTALPAITGTSLLTLQSPTIIDNSPNALTVTNNNGVTITAPPYLAKRQQYSNGTYMIAGTFDETSSMGYSVSLSGSGQYLSVPGSSPLAFGTGDFTIEGWFYPTVAPISSPVASSVKALYGYRNGADTLPYLYWVYSGGVSFGGDITNYLISNVQLSLNVWTHIAVVRIGTAMNMYINGTSVVSNSSVTQNFSDSTNVRYLGFFNGLNPYYFAGNISNFRVVKGIGIYTGNFTPSKSSLQTIQNSGLNVSAIGDPTTVGLLTCQNATIVDNSTYATTITNTGAATVLTTVAPF